MAATYAVWFVPTAEFGAGEAPGKYYAKVAKGGMTKADAERMVAEQHARPAVAAARELYGFEVRPE